MSEDTEDTGRIVALNIPTNREAMSVCIARNVSHGATLY